MLTLAALSKALKGTWKYCGVVVMLKVTVTQSKKLDDADTKTSSTPAVAPPATKATVEGVPPALP
jgi:hypothetical protein